MQKDNNKINTFRKWWKCLLFDAEMSETQLWKSMGTSQQGGNKKIVNGTVRWLEMIDILDHLGYKVTVSKKDD